MCQTVRVVTIRFERAGSDERDQQMKLRHSPRGWLITAASVAIVAGSVQVSSVPVAAGAPNTMYSSCDELTRDLQAFWQTKADAIAEERRRVLPATPTTTTPTTVKSEARSTAPPTTVAAAASPSPSPETNNPTSRAPEAPSDSGDVSDSSTTNVQEKGVDEGDLSDNDGRYLFTVVGGGVRIIDTKMGAIVSTVSPANPDTQLIRYGDRLAVLTPGKKSVLSIFDVSNRSLPRRLRTIRIPGNVLSFRAVGSQVRVVTNSEVAVPLFDLSYPTSLEQHAKTVKANNELIKAITAKSYLLGANDETGRPLGERLLCTQIAKSSFVGIQSASLTFVVDIDVRKYVRVQDVKSRIGFFGNAEDVYQTPTRLYIGSFRSVSGNATDGQPVSTGSSELLAFDLTAKSPRFLGSANVPGSLLNRYSLSTGWEIICRSPTRDLMWKSRSWPRSKRLRAASSRHPF
jgi:Beta propeller domain